MRIRKRWGRSLPLPTLHPSRMNMRYIVSEVYEAFRDAGVAEEKAKAAAGAIPVSEQLATKRDLGKAIGELKCELAILKFGHGPLIIGLLIKIAFFS